MSVLDYAKDIFENPAKYSKFWVSLAGTALIILAQYFPDAQWLQPVISLATAGGVISVPNKKEAK